MRRDYKSSVVNPLVCTDEPRPTPVWTNQHDYSVKRVSQKHSLSWLPLPTVQIALISVLNVGWTGLESSRTVVVLMKLQLEMKNLTETDWKFKQISSGAQVGRIKRHDGPDWVHGPWASHALWGVQKQDRGQWGHNKNDKQQFSLSYRPWSCFFVQHGRNIHSIW